MLCALISKGVSRDANWLVFRTQKGQRSIPEHRGFTLAFPFFLCLTNSENQPCVDVLLGKLTSSDFSFLRYSPKAVRTQGLRVYAGVKALTLSIPALPC